MMSFQASIRTFLGEWVGHAAAGPPTLPAGLPDAVKAIVADAVPALAIYQDEAYARLYLDRLKRFIGRRDLDPALFAAIAALMAERMMYQDPIRMAQLTLQASGNGARPVEQVCRFRYDELVSALPELAADPLLDLIGRIGWTRRTLKRRFSSKGALRLRRLRAEAWLRRWRMLTVRYAAEKIWVARWLHMIDRALTKRPESAAAVIETATMVQGYGDVYRQGLADWNAVIDNLAKPAFDGDLALPDLAAAIAQARAAARPDPKQVNLRRVIAEIRAGQGA